MSEGIVEQPALPTQEELRSHLKLVLAMPAYEVKTEQEFAAIMEKASRSLGEQNLAMGYFYYKYGDYFLRKVEDKDDCLNPTMVPEQKNNEDIEDSGCDDQDDSDSKMCPEQPEYEEEPPAQPRPEGQVNTTVMSASKNDEGGQNAQGEQIWGEDDTEVASDNLECALKICGRALREKKESGESVDSSITLDYLLQFNSSVHNSLGRLHMHHERYNVSLQHFKAVVKLETERHPIDYESIASGHLMIGVVSLLENKEKCEAIAIQHFCMTAKFMIEQLQSEGYNVSNMELPTSAKTTVNRWPYLPQAGDSTRVVELKQEISKILDKIEDAASDMEQRAPFEAEKRRMMALVENNKFQQVTETTNVVFLGKFGGGAKKPKPNGQSQPLTASLSSPPRNQKLATSSQSTRKEQDSASKESKQKVGEGTAITKIDEVENSSNANRSDV